MLMGFWGFGVFIGLILVKLACELALQAVRGRPAIPRL